MLPTIDEIECHPAWTEMLKLIPWNFHLDPSHLWQDVAHEKLHEWAADVGLEQVREWLLVLFKRPFDPTSEFFRFTYVRNSLLAWYCMQVPLREDRYSTRGFRAFFRSSQISGKSVSFSGGFSLPRSPEGVWEYPFSVSSLPPGAERKERMSKFRSHRRNTVKNNHVRVQDALKRHIQYNSDGVTGFWTESDEYVCDLLGLVLKHEYVTTGEGCQVLIGDFKVDL